MRNGAATRPWAIGPAAATISFVAISLAAAPAAAQEAPAVERRLIERAPPPALEVPPEELILTGEDDLVLLRRRKFFTLEAEYAPRYTTNAFLSDDREDDDLVHNGEVTARAETVIAETYAVYAEAGGFLARYAQNSELDYTGVTAGLGGQVPIDRFNLGIGYQYNLVEDRGFNERIIGQHELFGSLSLAFVIDQFNVLLPFVVVSRLWASPDDFTNTSVRPGLRFLHGFAPDLVLTADAEGVARFYDDFFEGVLNESREDLGARGELTLRWTPHANVLLLAGVGIGYVDSTIDFADYFEVSVEPSVSLRVRF